MKKIFFTIAIAAAVLAVGTPSVTNAACVRNPNAGYCPPGTCAKDGGPRACKAKNCSAANCSVPHNVRVQERPKRR